MDHLEDIIKQNREFFSQEKMPEGHLKRFEAKLKTEKKPVIKMLTPWMAAAAVILVVLMIPLLQKPVETPQGVLSSVNPKYSEVEFYFASSIQNSVEQMVTYVQMGVATEDDRDMVNEELEELEKRHQQLMKDLELAPDDEVIINAMIEVYQKKLQVINSILEQLYEVKQHKDSVENYSSNAQTSSADI